jgi:hypothetical protein
MRVAVVRVSNNALIPPGDLYTCSFASAVTTPAGTYALTTAASASDPTGVALAANGLAGDLTVLAGPGNTGSGLIGDCDGNGVVSIAEVQATINIFLGVQPLATCTAADANGDTLVDIVEAQNAVNNHVSP